MTPKYEQCVDSLLKVRLLLNDLGVPSSLILVGTVGTRDASRSRSRIDIVPLPRTTSPLLLVFLFFYDTGETASISGSPCDVCVFPGKKEMVNDLNNS